METKICSKCGIKKLIKEFYKCKSHKDGYDSWCKQCYSELHKIYYQKNAKKLKDYRKQWYLNNTKKSTETSKAYYQKNTEQINNQHKRYMKNYREQNVDNINKYGKKYYQDHKKERNEYIRNRIKNDPIFKLNNNIRTGIWDSLKNKKNGYHWESLVGYTLIDLKIHLENQFKDGMTWENQGRNGWHIDHIIPISLFNITSVKCKGFKQCWFLENLQPLWEKDNLEKSNKIFY